MSTLGKIGSSSLGFAPLGTVEIRESSAPPQSLQTLDEPVIDTIVSRIDLFSASTANSMLQTS
jgi:hypothetical protein